MKTMQLGILSLILISLVSYMMMVAGLPDALLIRPKRWQRIEDIKLAGVATPVDLDYLLENIQGHDWLVTAVALEQIAYLEKNGLLPDTRMNETLQTIFINLGERGHWWRLGWDLEESDFSMFSSQVIETASIFGTKALPYLEDSATDRRSRKREAVCLIVDAMLRKSDETQNANLTEPILKIVTTLAQSDPDNVVRATCSETKQHLIP